MAEMKSASDTIKIWEERAREVYNESLKLMREGIHGLEVMAGKTMEATRLRLANQKMLHQMKALFMEIGQKVYESAVNKKVTQVKIKPDFNELVKRIRKIKSDVDKNLEHLQHLSTVSGSSSGRRMKKGKEGGKGG